MSTNIEQYKVVVLGDENTGKTQFINRFLTGHFSEKYVATLGVEVHPLLFGTNYGTYQFNIWDCAGNKNLGGLHSGYYINADACIAFYTKNSDHERTDEMVRKFLEINPEAKLVIVWNKCDLAEESEYISNRCGGEEVLRGFGCDVYMISGKSMYNQEKPILSLLRGITGRGDLVVG